MIEIKLVFGLLFMNGLQLCVADKPTDLSQGIFCEGCVATVTELEKKVNKKTGESREVRVVDSMEDICNLQNFGSYEYSPPKTGQACRYLIENYDEDIEKIFVKETEDLQQKICYELTKACAGVDRSKKEKEEMDFRINDEKQKIERGPMPTKGPETVHLDINDKDAADKLIQSINESVDKKQSNDDGDDEDENDKEEL